MSNAKALRIFEGLLPVSPPGVPSFAIAKRDKLLALASHVKEKSPCNARALANRLPARARTWDPLIKSQLLCQLSYGEG